MAFAPPSVRRRAAAKNETDRDEMHESIEGHEDVGQPRLIAA
jgi:hypothetical protein